jgi:hypothetical protein
MTDFSEVLANLRRPRLLIRAARFGQADYRRERDLQRLIGVQTTPRSETALPRLLTAEEELEQTRKAGDATYSLTRHIDVLIALLAEARLLPRGPQAQA